MLQSQHHSEAYDRQWEGYGCYLGHSCGYGNIHGFWSETLLRQVVAMGTSTDSGLRPCSANGRAVVVTLVIVVAIS